MKSTKLLEKGRQKPTNYQDLLGCILTPLYLGNGKSHKKYVGYYMKRILHELNIKEKKSSKLVEKIKASLSNQKTPLLASFGYF